MIIREKSKLQKALDIIQKEPNYETFEYRGYKCVIKRMMYLGGQLNGYVRIPKASKFYDATKQDMGYDDIPIECHGGLTFTGKLEDEPEDEFYIGFDTAHFQDYMPFMQFQLSQYFNHEHESETYKDINYVRKECRDIVDQLLVLEQENADNTETS